MLLATIDLLAQGSKNCFTGNSRNSVGSQNYKVAVRLLFGNSSCYVVKGAKLRIRFVVYMLLPGQTKRLYRPSLAPAVAGQKAFKHTPARLASSSLLGSE